MDLQERRTSRLTSCNLKMFVTWFSCASWSE